MEQVTAKEKTRIFLEFGIYGVGLVAYFILNFKSMTEQHDNYIALRLIVGAFTLGAAGILDIRSKATVQNTPMIAFLIALSPSSAAITKTEDLIAFLIALIVVLNSICSIVYLKKPFPAWLEKTAKLVSLICLALGLTLLIMKGSQLGITAIPTHQ